MPADGDGISHMAQWRRRQLCWGTQDVHNDNNRWGTLLLAKRKMSHYDLRLLNLPCGSPSDHQSYKLGDAGDKTTGVCRDIDLILDLCPPR